ncbi:hypothetical protein [Roseimaritima ulvae]|uniref:Uncharacterized protein n=1 Tax=Roseimaritima ulvae TaxID=980254 RepID=A0A5B9QPY8_9BACT|nr:hypothetical protein [Roseimaritima ulvae]QEG41034.1 hypothetical protein UC8_30520 [Roseimaritima ulvae]
MNSPSLKAYIVAIEDEDVEGDEVAKLVIEAPTSEQYVVGTWGSGEVVIEDGQPTVSIEALIDTATEAGDDGLFRISRTGDTSEALEVSVNLNSGWKTDYELPGVIDGVFANYVVIPQNAEYVDVAVDAILDDDSAEAEEGEYAEMTIDTYWGPEHYSIDQSAKSARVEIDGDHACNQLVSNPSDNETCLIIDHVDVFIELTVQAATSQPFKTMYRVPNEVLETLEMENLTSEEEDDLWENIKDWGAENWDDVVDVPVELSRFSEMLIPSANVADTQIDLVKMRFLSQAVGKRFKYDSNVHRWIQDTEDNAPALYRSDTALLADASHDYPFDVSLVDLKKHQQGGMFEYITGIRTLFLDMHEAMKTPPRPDVKAILQPIISADANYVSWFGEEPEGGN